MRLASCCIARSFHGAFTQHPASLWQGALGFSVPGSPPTHPDRSFFPSPSHTEPAPRHVAIIMDGNGRWAQGQRAAPHRGPREGRRGRPGDRAPRPASRGLECLTLFAFSTLNWQRPDVRGPRSDGRSSSASSIDELPEMLQNGIRLVAIGERELLPAQGPHAPRRGRGPHGPWRGHDPRARGQLRRPPRPRARRPTDRRARPPRRAPPGRRRRSAARLGSLSTADLPDVDLLVRTSGEIRLSGFLPFEACYAELHFTADRTGPTSAPRQLDEAIANYRPPPPPVRHDGRAGRGAGLMARRVRPPRPPHRQSSAPRRAGSLSP
jgi:undecaprenyl diphosphate synthase